MLLLNEKNTANHKVNLDEFEGSKIPITELILEIKNKAGDVIYRDINVLIGNDLPPSKIDDERKKMRDKASSILRRNNHARRTP